MIKSPKYRIVVSSIFIISALAVILIGVEMDNSINTVKNEEVTYLKEKVDNAKWKFRYEIGTIEKMLKVAVNFADNSVLTPSSFEENNNFAIPFLNSFSRLKTFVIADVNGNEYAITKEDGTWLSSVNILDNGNIYEKKDRWKIFNNKVDTIDKWITAPNEYDPRRRPWFQMALGNEIQHQVNWTNPYVFHTQMMPGITVSVKSTKQSPVAVVGLDILLTDMSDFTMNFSEDNSSKAFILTNDLKILGVPFYNNMMSEKDVKSLLMKDYKTLKQESFTNAVSKWVTLEKNKYEPFTYHADNNKWYCQIVPYNLEGDKYFLMGIIIPESSLHKSANFIRIVSILIFSLAFVLLIRIATIQLIRLYRKK